MWTGIFIGFGIVTIISGILLITMKDYLVGISGSVVGVWLVLQNMKQLKDNNGK